MYAHDCGQVVGIEPEFDAVQTATHNIPHASFLCGSGMNLPFVDDSFDVVLFTLSLHHHADHLGALAEAQRVTGSTGSVLALEPTPESEVQQFCKPFEDEDHRLIAAENALSRCPLETVSKETFTTQWMFEDFEDAAEYAFTYYDHPPDTDKREALRTFLESKAADAPVWMTDTLCLTCLRSRR